MNTDSDHDAIVRWLAEPAAYPHRPERVEHIQTHISDVFIAGEDVYKLKKPVKFDFLDFSAPWRRKHWCREEVELNRRLAPDTYLNIVPVTRGADGNFQLGGEGPVVDWLVHMRRLPTDRTLDALHRCGALRPEDIDRLINTLVPFYRALPLLPITPPEYRDRCLAHVRGNLRELATVNHHLPHNLVERVHSFQLQRLLLEPELFEIRARYDRIVEGHGDLRPEHICLADRVVVFDCIEFNPELRQLDIADELAFLAAECDFLGAEWVGPRLLKGYQDQTGDRVPPVLFDFYKSYRACVRAKVAALRADQLQCADQQAATAEAARHLNWADRYASSWLQPIVLVVGGLAGTGKTTLAAALAEALGAELLRTDAIRQELFGKSTRTEELDEGIYSPASREQVYMGLFQRAAALHNDRVSVVLDGTFASVSLLQQANVLCTDSRSLWLAIECVCPPAVAQQRIADRLAAGQDASAARPELHDVQRSRWETWPADLPHIQVDTTLPVTKQVAAVIARLAENDASLTA